MAEKAAMISYRRLKKAAIISYTWRTKQQLSAIHGL
jgi:hypothetical protein